MSEPDTVVVARFDGPGAWSDAEVMRLRLAASGIDAFVAGDRHAPSGFFTAGLVRLEVRAGDAERAAEVLDG